MDVAGGVVKLWVRSGFKKNCVFARASIGRISTPACDDASIPCASGSRIARSHLRIGPDAVAAALGKAYAAGAFGVNYVANSSASIPAGMFSHHSV